MNVKADRKFLTDLGIDVGELQDIAIEKVPCAIESVKEAWNDKTDMFVNAPRALMVVQWKGIVRGLIEANKFVRKDRG